MRRTCAGWGEGCHAALCRKAEAQLAELRARLPRGPRRSEAQLRALGRATRCPAAVARRLDAVLRIAAERARAAPHSSLSAVGAANADVGVEAQ